VNQKSSHRRPRERFAWFFCLVCDWAPAIAIRERELWGQWALDKCPQCGGATDAISVE